MISQTPEDEANRFYVYLVAIVAAMGGFLFGYDLQLISGAILYLTPHFGLTPGQEGWAMASAFCGCLVGPFAGGALADSALGRKWSLLAAAAMFLVASIGSSTATTFTQLSIFRIVSGFGAGLASVVAPLYIAEISPAEKRGRLVSLNQFMIVMGAFGASMAAWLVAKFATPDTGWRWMFVSTLVPIICLTVGVLFIPHTPRWLAQRGRMDEAIRILTRINGRAGAQREMLPIREQLAGEQGGWAELFRPGPRKALLIVLLLAFFQQWTGVSPATYYAPVIMEMAGFTKADALRQFLLANAFNVVGTIFAVMAVDHVGRRPLLLCGLAGMCVGMSLWGVAFHLHAPGWMVMVTFLLSFGSFLISMAPLPWLIMSELFPNRVRARGMSLGAMTTWGGAFTAILALGPFMRWAQVQHGSPAVAFWIFAGVCAVAWIFGFRMVPETRGRTLEQISDLFLHEQSVAFPVQTREPVRDSA